MYQSGVCIKADYINVFQPADLKSLVNLNDLIISIKTKKRGFKIWINQVQNNIWYKKLIFASTYLTYKCNISETLLQFFHLLNPVG